MTRSPTLLRLLATTVGVPLVVAEVPESASLGCAILIAIATGAHPDVAAATAAMVRTHAVEPDAPFLDAYTERYRRWRELCASLQSWTI
jgi:L-ribulokinase